MIRWLSATLLVLALGACTSDDEGGRFVDAAVVPTFDAMVIDAPGCGPVPIQCGAHCVTYEEVLTCCDSLTCNCAPGADSWEVVWCDEPPHADCGPVPGTCVGHCQISTPDFELSDCCDSTTCNCNPST